MVMKTNKFNKNYEDYLIYLLLMLMGSLPILTYFGIIK